MAAIRESMEHALGQNNHAKYMTSLRDWFSQKTSKDDFDLDVLPFLDGTALQLHNQFMFVLLNECQNPPTLSIKPAPPSNDSNLNQNVGTVKRIVPKRRKSSANNSKFQIEKVRLMAIMSKIRPPEPKDSRFPEGFIRRFIRTSEKKKLYPNIIHNVTHIPTALNRHIAKDPKLAKFFAPRKGPDQPYLTCNPSVQGKLLLKAWSKGINTIESEAVDLVVKSCHAHIKKILTSLLKRRKEIATQDDSRDSLADVSQNPFLSRGSYVENFEKKPEPEEIGGFIRIFPSQDQDRIAALEAVCSIPAQSSRVKTKATTADLFEVIQADSSLIPCGKSRHLLKEKLFLLSSGNSGFPPAHTRIQVENGLDVDENDCDEEDLLPICSY